MQLNQTFRLLVASILWFSSCAAAWDDRDPAVIELTEDTLHALMLAEHPVFIKFDSPACPACDKLQQVWSELAVQYGEVQFARLDCGSYESACEARNVIFDAASPSPVLKFWSGTGFRRFTGAASRANLEAYIERRLGGARQGSAHSGAAPPSSKKPAIKTEEYASQMPVVLLLPLVLLGCWALRMLAFYLGLPREESDGWMLLVGSGGRQPQADGAQVPGCLYLFRLDPPVPQSHKPEATKTSANKGASTAFGCTSPTLTPIGWLPAARTRISALAVELASKGLWLHSWYPCMVVHAAGDRNARGDADLATRDASIPDSADRAGCLVSLLFDPRTSPPLSVIGVTDVPDKICSSLCLFTNGRRFKTAEKRHLASSSAVSGKDVEQQAVWQGDVRPTLVAGCASGDLAVFTHETDKRNNAMGLRLAGVVAGCSAAQPAHGRAIAAAVEGDDAAASRVLHARNGALALLSGADSTKRANKRKRARICVDGTLELQTKAEVVCVCTPPGSSVCYVLTSDDELHACSTKPGSPMTKLSSLRIGRGKASWPAIAPPLREHSAALVVCADGRFCYALPCSGGELLVLSLSHERSPVRVEQLSVSPSAHVSLALAVDDAVLVLADADANSITLYPRDSESGRLGVPATFACDAPHCVLPIRWPPRIR